MLKIESYICLVKFFKKPSLRLISAGDLQKVNPFIDRNAKVNRPLRYVRKSGRGWQQ